MTEQQFQELIARLDRLESQARSLATSIATVREEIYQQMSLLPLAADPDDIIGAAQPQSMTKAENAAALSFLKLFSAHYAKHRHGARYMMVPARHVPLVRQLLKTYGPSRLEKLALVLLKTDDEWTEGTDRGIGVLHTKASWLDSRLSAYEAAHGPIQV